MAAERRRRNQDTKKENNERWVISYADFMTLLLATFVVLYAVSSINVSRYRAAAEALSAVFTGKVIVPDRGQGANPNGIFQNQPAPVPKPVVRLDLPQKGIPKPDVKPNSMHKSGPTVPENLRERIAKLDQAYKNLSRLLGDVIDKGQVHIARKGLSVVIDINASVLFDSGKADLTTSALGVIDQIGVVLKDQPYSIQVNGYTDNAPIHTAQFGSNWELSAMRAISVVRRFVNDGVDPSHLVGAGYGEYHPVANNDDPDGRVKNRRVSIVVVSDDDADNDGDKNKSSKVEHPVPAKEPPKSSSPKENAAMLPGRSQLPVPVPAITAPVSSTPVITEHTAAPAATNPASGVKSPSLPKAVPPNPVLNQTDWPFAPGQSH